MQKLTFWLLCAFVFSVPWENVVVFPLIGTVSRLFGIFAIAAGVLTISASGRIRKPSAPVWIAAGLTLAAVLSLSWTISYAATLSQVLTYLQLLGLVWLVWNSARRAEQQNSLMAAYCLGAYVAFADTLRQFFTGVVQRPDYRFAATNFNPNEFGLTLALGIPMAWHLSLTQQGITRLMARAYLPLAIVSILLTASRGAFLACILALSIIPLTVGAITVRRFVALTVLLVAAVTAAAIIVPSSSWTRIFTARQEIRSGSVGGRGMIWSAGWSMFQERPLLGYGAGAFEQAVAPAIGPQAAHNVPLGILVEQGLVGFVAFVLLFTACAYLLAGLPRLQQRLWAVIALTWLLGAMSGDTHRIKVTWLLFGLFAVNATAVEMRTGKARQPRPTMKSAIQAHNSFLGRGDTERVWNSRVR